LPPFFMIDFFSQINEDLWISDGILSDKECRLLITEAKPLLSKSTILKKKNSDPSISEYRTSNTATLEKTNYSTQHEGYDVISKIEKVVQSLSFLPIENQEPLQVLQYSRGNEYKEHHDFFHEGTDYYEEQIKKGGQRLFSVLFYLNNVSGGGETCFPKWDFNVTPREGRVVFWRNYKLGPIFESLHKAEPVVGGSKWVAVKWVREAPYTE